MLEEYYNLACNDFLQVIKYIWFIFLLFLTFLLIYSVDIKTKYAFDVSFLRPYVFVITGISLIYIILESIIVAYVDKNNSDTSNKFKNNRLIVMGFFIMFYFLFF